jgi:hypothetical protein
VTRTIFSDVHKSKINNLKSKFEELVRKLGFRAISSHSGGKSKYVYTIDPYSNESDSDLKRKISTANDLRVHITEENRYPDQLEIDIISEFHYPGKIRISSHSITDSEWEKLELLEVSCYYDVDDVEKSSKTIRQIIKEIMEFFNKVFNILCLSEEEILNKTKILKTEIYKPKGILWILKTSETEMLNKKKTLKSNMSIFDQFDSILSGSSL